LPFIFLLPFFLDRNWTYRFSGPGDFPILVNYVNNTENHENKKSIFRAIYCLMTYIADPPSDFAHR
jgi:hypothetical protein